MWLATGGVVRRIIVLAIVLAAAGLVVGSCGSSGTTGSPSPTVTVSKMSQDGDSYVGYWRIPSNTPISYRLLAVRPAGSTYQVKFDTLRWHRADIVKGSLSLQKVYHQGGYYAPRLDLAVGHGQGTIRMSASPSPAPYTLTRLTEQQYQTRLNAMADSQLKFTLLELTGAAKAWAEQHGGRPPEAADMRGDSSFGRNVARQAVQWPMNPFTGEAIRIGSEPGDISYSTNGRTFTLTAVSSDGGTLRP